MDRRSVLGAPIALAVLLFSGCEAEPPQLVTVRGKVFYKNVPLHGGIIVFTPDPVRNGDGPTSHAEIQTDGAFLLRTDNALGAMPGWHRVTISAFEDASGRPPLPSRFSDPERSGLSFEVKPGQENVIDIRLE